MYAYIPIYLLFLLIFIPFLRDIQDFIYYHFPLGWRTCNSAGFLGTSSSIFCQLKNVFLSPLFGEIFSPSIDSYVHILFSFTPVKILLYYLLASWSFCWEGPLLLYLMCLFFSALKICILPFVFSSLMCLIIFKFIYPSWDVWWDSSICGFSFN